MDSAQALTADFPWDDAAWEEVSHAPRHLHDMIRAICNDQARQMGKARVDMEVVEILKAEHMGGGGHGGAKPQPQPPKPAAAPVSQAHAAAAMPPAAAGMPPVAGASSQAQVGAARDMASATPAVPQAGIEPLSADRIQRASAPSAVPQAEIGAELDPFLDLYAQEGVDPLSGAFARRSPPHVSLPSARVDAGKLQETWLEALRMDLPQQRRRSLYLHVPFCRCRCSYCPFYLMAYRDDAAADYVDLLVRDIELTASQIPAFDADSGGEYQAIFFGGGTPSDLSSAQLTRLITALRRNFPLSRDCEITVEGRVVGFEKDKAQACRDAGATRISLGVQSFDTKVRQGVGRIADEAQVCRTLEALGSIDGLALNIDLMYGLPGQDAGVWERDIARVNQLSGIRGVDLYELKRIPGSPLTKAQGMGRVALGVDLPERSQMYAYGAATLEAAGWERLSCCHWGRGGNRQNRYNVYAKSGATCLPFGCCGGGRVGLLSVGGPQDVNEYRAMLDRGEKPLSGARRLSDIAAVHDRIAGQLEFGRLDPESVQPGLRGYLLPLLEQWTRSGLLERAHGSWGLTLAGRFWIKELSSRLALALR